ncbi:MAG: sulfatase-like hydrolase/transferase [Paludibacter sp.]
MYSYLRFIFLSALASSSTISLAEQLKTQQTPNILLILADDLGYGDLSCQGATDMKTPNIDRIFKSGIQFKNCYANSTVSSPSRASLLTGCYPDMVGVPGVIRTNKNDSWGYLSTNARLLPQELKKVNYNTAIIGKWHLGLETPNTPNERGFDEFRGFLGDMMDDYYTHLRSGVNYMRINQKVDNPAGHATEVFTGWAIDYLQKQEKSKQPFFLYLAYNAPHDPIQPPKEWHEKVITREKNITDKRAKIVALIEHLDDNIGLVLKQLELSAELENTLIIFTSDNGGSLEHGANNGSYRGGKGDLYEGGIRVPAAIMWRNKIKSGQVLDNMVILMDLFPTINEIAGHKSQYPIDGISLLPLISGNTQITDERMVCFMRREGKLKYGGLCYYSARYKQFKIVQNTPWEPMQIFDLSTDPYEMNPIDKNENHNYEQLFTQLTNHISSSGAVPWQKISK